MVDADIIAYNLASFACALFVLEFGADKFVDHTAIVAKRTGIPPTIIALLTAGAEWEELAVVVISIARNRASLAVGNIVGSTISNILGAFSLGLVFHTGQDAVVFDRSSKLYSLVLLILTVIISGILAFEDHIVGRAVGGFTIALFTLYLASIAWAISRGTVTAPELSDSDSSDGSDTDEPPSRTPSLQHANRTALQESEAVQSLGTNGPICREHALHSDVERTMETGAQMHAETTPLLASHRTNSSTHSTFPTNKHGLSYHILLLLLGFSALILSAYVLSHSASTLVTQLGISDVLFGVVILSIATTLPEKFIAVVSGSRNQMGISVANTVGSNIFLLTLCMGVLWTATGGLLDQDSVHPAEIAVMLASSAWMTMIIWFGAKWARLIGWAMLAAYVAFIVLEFTIIRHV